MSASSGISAIFLTDTPEMIAKKIKKYAFSGGQETLEKQKELGADLEVDMTYQYLQWFLEDEALLAKIGQEYSSGKMTTAQVKEIAIDCMTKLVLRHQAARAQVTDQMIDDFLSIRKMKM